MSEIKNTQLDLSNLFTSFKVNNDEKFYTQSDWNEAMNHLYEVTMHLGQPNSQYIEKIRRDAIEFMGLPEQEYPKENIGL